ncbi:6,7-dimethyl-8-ribityllumazine synthase [Oharaeibacter diazotrophicus]|uniref:6,7-dimethyl-8-ribityllumazine synthase n=1 Tax=Oharaeibacter diazotrophicus TaxID=1920512 RepID=A0A4R6RM21_9HYPH|nr:6,7-dimethyl-8-ribityllumazine synthase [Oharaeibacter diazotrophicus]TDP87185.1 6,7-dimethyl-8-ribityllumazine synthase [Oharaeibacter diazotrophicus]BBE70872.1 6,7-dimethyl-8-ribityllumazine synthase 2 [Pleomorphomonas sp. SM30]GLS77621.1 6,7-dimethyl-8-ribityllumazine synthase [Oharaeibacter diazotrophicus]
MNQIVTPPTTAFTATGRPASRRVAIVQALWHRDVVDRAVESFVERLVETGTPREDVDVFAVPGVFEIPLRVQELARTGRYGAVAATGLIVDGGIYRHEFVSTAVIDGLMRVQLDTGVPVLTAVLTPIRYHEHDEHRGFFREHFVVKGRELADAARAVLASTEPVAA